MCPAPKAQSSLKDGKGPSPGLRLPLTYTLPLEKKEEEGLCRMQAVPHQIPSAQGSLCSGDTKCVNTRLLALRSDML